MPAESESSSPDERDTISSQLPDRETPATGPHFSAPENFINRELSWLEFNRRVLEEAQDPTQPLIERVKFLTIFSSNLDEFFEIRVAGIKQQIESETSDVGPDGLTPTETFNAIQRDRARTGRDASTRSGTNESRRLWPRTGFASTMSRS